MSSSPKFAVSDVCKAFEASGVGTRVLQRERFMSALAAAVAVYDFAACRVPGQGFVPLPDALGTVSCGVGRRTNDPDHYVVRIWRSRPAMFMRREFAAAAEALNVAVYTTAAYLADPQVQTDETETARILAERPPTTSSSGCSPPSVRSRRSDRKSS